MRKFELHSEFTPQGDQGQAIEKLAFGLAEGARHQVLMGVTGSGKTFTMANIIARAQRPVLVISHNKTLAAQLYQEFRRFFPRNAVEYFVSYYDYYQPEAYIPASNTYIAKEAPSTTRSTASDCGRRTPCSRGATSSSSPPSPASTASGRPRRITR